MKYDFVETSEGDTSPLFSFVSQTSLIFSLLSDFPTKFMIPSVFTGLSKVLIMFDTAVFFSRVTSIYS